MSTSSEIYPNQPLVEVVFEIRFPGDLGVECEKHRFWNKIRNEYPKVYVPRSAPDEAVALMPYKFRSEDGHTTVMLALNSFAVSSSRYPGFERFREEVIRLYELFSDIYSISTVTRIGWRYINVIPFVRENGVIPLDRYLLLGFKIPNSIPERFKTLSLTFESSGTNGVSIITKLDTLKRSDKTEEALLLDFDYGRTGKDGKDLQFKKVPAYLDEAHANTRQLFEDFITDEYRQYLRGDTI